MAKPKITPKGKSSLKKKTVVANFSKNTAVNKSESGTSQKLNSQKSTQQKALQQKVAQQKALQQKAAQQKAAKQKALQQQLLQKKPTQQTSSKNKTKSTNSKTNKTTKSNLNSNPIKSKKNSSNSQKRNNSNRSTRKKATSDSGRSQIYLFGGLAGVIITGLILFAIFLGGEETQEKPNLTENVTKPSKTYETEQQIQVGGIIIYKSVDDAPPGAILMKNKKTGEMFDIASVNKTMQTRYLKNKNYIRVK